MLGAALLGACAFTPVEVELQAPVSAQSSRIYAADGRLITVLHAEENRENVTLDEMPRHLVDAVVAVEDARFFDHRGVDVKAILRAALANVSEGEVVEGGSTITQQYVKNALLDPDRTINRKVEEALLAIQLEQRYTKERILELYLNTIYLGNGAYGVQAAAFEYFGVPAAELTLAQAALLAALIRAPSTTDPYRRPEQALARRNRVIDRMVSLGWLDPRSAEAARTEPLGLGERRAEERYAAPHFVERVKRFVLDDPRFGATPAERRALLFTGGLRIHTTVDLDLQAQAEAAVSRVLSDRARDPDAALVAIDNRTGFVRALVGGDDFFGGGERAKLDHATQARRPAGSSFKPLVLAAAIEEGIPLDRVYPAPGTMEIPLTHEVWRVSNYGGGGGGHVDLHQATVRSYNTVYAQLIMDVGPADAVAMASRLGVLTPLEPFPSAVLGTNPVSPLDMAAAYSTFANRGLRIPPAFVTRVVGPDGSVLYEHRHTQARAVSRHTADLVTGVLVDAVEHGTGTRARIGRPVAGKTGTGQEWRDAWFVGYTPELTTAVWIGFSEEGLRSMVPPRTRIRVTGGSWPAEIFQLFMSAALAEVPVLHFAEPEAAPEDGEEGDGTPADVSLPVVRDVVGLPAGPATEVLTRNGFVVVRQDTPSDDYPPGIVVAQRPPAGSRARDGTTVMILVSDGTAASGVVPDVLAMPGDDAAAAIRRAGFAVELIEEAEPPAPGAEHRTGRVWKQSPAGGTRRTTGSTVTIWVNPPDAAEVAAEG